MQITPISQRRPDFVYQPGAVREKKFSESLQKVQTDPGLYGSNGYRKPIAERLEKMRTIGTIFEKKFESDYQTGVKKFDLDLQEQNLQNVKNKVKYH